MTCAILASVVAGETEACVIVHVETGSADALIGSDQKATRFAAEAVGAQRSEASLAGRVAGDGHTVSVAVHVEPVVADALSVGVLEGVGLALDTVVVE